LLQGLGAQVRLKARGLANIVSPRYNADSPHILSQRSNHDKGDLAIAISILVQALRESQNAITQ